MIDRHEGPVDYRPLQHISDSAMAKPEVEKASFANRVGMPVYWHNRRGLDLGGRARPLVEHDSLAPLLDTLAAGDRPPGSQRWGEP